MVQHIYVARHGLRANLDPPPTGIDGDPRITVEGETQAKELGDFLSDPSQLNGDRITAIYSSPFYRCLQTATPTSEKLAVPIWVDPGIGEHYGVTRPTKPVPWPASRSKSVFSAIDLDYTPQIVPSTDGETRQSLTERVSQALEHIFAHADAKGHETILIVTHAAIKIVIGEILSGATVRSGTCSVDKYVRKPNASADEKPFECVLAGCTHFLSGGEQMHWSFDMAYEAGSAADELSRQETAAAKHGENLKAKSALVSLDFSSLSAAEMPESVDASEMIFTKLETDRPVIQIGVKIYEGEWQRIVGTEVYTSSQGEPLGLAKHRIRLLPASVEIPERDARPLVERLAEVQREKSLKATNVMQE